MISVNSFVMMRLREVKRFVKNPKRVIRRTIDPVFREQERLAGLVGPEWEYWHELQNYQLNFLKTMGMVPHHRLLDIGCGPLQGGIAFISYLNPNNYVGVDVRDVPLIEAYKQIIKHRLVCKNPQLVLSDSFGWHELTGFQFDYVWTCQMFYHLEPETICRYFEYVSSLLKPGGLLYGDIIGYPNNVKEDSHWSGFKFYLHTLEFMENASRRHGLTMKHLGQIRDHGYPEKINLHTNTMLQFQKTGH